MCLTNEHVGPKILANIKIYVLTRAELLFTLCYEIPCTSNSDCGDRLREISQKLSEHLILKFVPNSSL